MRSVRPTDTQVVWPLGGIFAYSGGAPYAVDSIETVPRLILVNETQAGDAMFRDQRSRSAAQSLCPGATSLRLQRNTHAAARAVSLPHRDKRR